MDVSAAVEYLHRDTARMLREICSLDALTETSNISDGGSVKT